MAKKSTSSASPLTFDLPEPLIAKIASAKKKFELSSASEVVRLAIIQFDFDRYTPSVAEHRQISVRLPDDMKTSLARHSRKKKVSVGELLRVAIDQLALPTAKAAKVGKTAKAAKATAKASKTDKAGAKRKAAKKAKRGR